jgi:autotransporter-associated beta strand protein
LNLTTTAGVFNMVVTNNTLTYTLNGNGSLSGPMTLTKTGTGTLIKANLGSDAYTGGTIVQQGVLDVRSSTALGSGVVTLAGGTLANRGATPVSPTNTIFAQTTRPPRFKRPAHRTWILAISPAVEIWWPSIPVVGLAS